jgi:dCMP deaminase
MTGKSNRPTWDELFLEICDVVAQRSTCNRKHVGAVLVTPDHHIISTGYNGSMPTLPHCDDAGHDMDEGGHCVRTVHSEVNVICQAAKLGISTKGAILYCNTLPCWSCFKTIISAGIGKIVYRDEYPSEGQNRVKETAKTLYNTTGFVLWRYE